MAEQMVTLFGFSRREQETSRLTFKRSIDFRHQLLAHQDELTRGQHQEMDMVSRNLASVPYSEFVEDRFGIQFVHERERSRTKHSLRVDRTATVSKLVDAMVPIARRYARGGRSDRGSRSDRGDRGNRGARGETKVETKSESKTAGGGRGGGGGGSTPHRRTMPRIGERNHDGIVVPPPPPSVSTRRTSPSVPSTKRPSMPSVPSPRGMSPSGSRGRQMLRNDSFDNTPTTPTPVVPRRNKRTVENHQQQRRERQREEEEEEERRNRGNKRDERSTSRHAETQQRQQQQQDEDQSRQRSPVTEVATLDDWDESDSDDQPTLMEIHPPRRTRPLTPPSDPEETDNHFPSPDARQQQTNTQQTNKDSVVIPPRQGGPTRVEIQGMFVRAGMSDRTARMAMEKVFTFDGVDWSEGDLAQAVTNEEGADFFLRVLEILEIPGVGNIHVKQGILTDKFWGKDVLLNDMHTGTLSSSSSSSSSSSLLTFFYFSHFFHFLFSPLFLSERNNPQQIVDSDIQPFADVDEVVDVVDMSDLDDDSIDSRSPRLRHREATSNANNRSGTSSGYKPKRASNSMVLEEMDDFDDDFGEDDFI